MAEIKTDRNREIYEAVSEGASFSEIGEKFGVSTACVRQIFQKEKQKEEIRQDEVYKVLITLTDDEKFITRTLTVLRRHKINTCEELKKVFSRKDLLGMRNCGETMMELLLKAASVLRGDDASMRGCPIYGRGIDESYCRETTQLLKMKIKKFPIEELNEVKDIREAKAQCRNCIYNRIVEE